MVFEELFEVLNCDDEVEACFTWRSAGEVVLWLWEGGRKEVRDDEREDGYCRGYGN